MVKVLRVGEPGPAMQIDAPQVAHRFWNRVITKQAWFDEGKEHVVVLLLSTRYDVQGYSLVSIGTLNESLAHPREIFRAAVASGSYGIAVMHNHPSGDPWPSESDHRLTRRLSEAADILQIKLVDHVIVSHPRAHTLNTVFQRRCRVRRTSRVKREKAEAISRGYFSFKEQGIL
jgi:DNA repair protein RadC